ncbi:HET domain-containing protein [Colletotrichum higginsianum]|nr:HET domain-containing protein [Colletotrichum higginsianum]
MRLLQRDNANNYTLTADLRADDAPPYAILSHTWGADEVVYEDVEKNLNDWQRKSGYDKIRFCADQAKRHGLQHFWADTCCIDKSDAVEFQTAINSMFKWYRGAKRCYVYLSDVSCPSISDPPPGITTCEAALRGSRWFTRGWTLQELIAPQIVEFYSKEGAFLGDKRSLEAIIRDVTGIPARALRNTPLSSFTISEREAWARNRETKHEEDMVYSLLGLSEAQNTTCTGVRFLNFRLEDTADWRKGGKTKDLSQMSLSYWNNTSSNKSDPYFFDYHTAPRENVA